MKIHTKTNNEQFYQMLCWCERRINLGTSFVNWKHTDEHGKIDQWELNDEDALAFLLIFKEYQIEI